MRTRDIWIAIMIALLLSAMFASAQGATTPVVPTKSRKQSIEEKLERIESLLQRVIDEKHNEIRAIKEFDVCLDRCAKDYPWSKIDEEDNGYKNKKRHECIDRCGKSTIGYQYEC